jgi:hypothetical protein
MWLRSIVVSAAIILISPGVDAAQRDTRDCLKAGDPAQTIRACTKLVSQRSRWTESLAGAYINRGVAYAATDDLNRAVKDFSKVVRLSSSLHI